MSQEQELPRPQPQRRPSAPVPGSISTRVIAHDDLHYTVTQHLDRAPRMAASTPTSASPIPSGPPPAPRPRPRPLQLRPPNPTPELLQQANGRLAAGDAAGARDRYTQVLREACPGHPVALLNRALAHLALGHPELAAMDAYRAAELLVELQAREQRERARQRLVSERGRRPPLRRRSGGGPQIFLRGPRAGMVREPSMPEVERDDPIVPPANFRPDAAWDRWAPGAADENHDTLEDLRAQMRAEAQEDTGLAHIERQLLAYQSAEERAVRCGDAFTRAPGCFVGKADWLRRGLAAIVITPDPDAHADREGSLTFRLELRAVYRLAGALGAVGMGGVHDAMGLLDDLLRRERVRERRDLRLRYPHEHAQLVALGDALVQDALDLAGGSGVSSRGFADNLRQTKISVVQRVIYPGTSEVGGIDSYDTFREMMGLVDAVARRCMPRLLRETADAPRACMLVAAEDIREGEQLLAEDSIFQVSTKTTHEGRPLCDACASVLDASPAALELLRHCPGCDAVFCSYYCYEVGLEYHDPPCGRQIENDVRAWFIMHPSRQAANDELGRVSLRLHQKAWLLCVLMLVRILSYAAMQRKRALDLPAVKLLNGGLKAARQDRPVAQRSKELPWTFKTHVLMPVWIQKEMGIRAHAELDSFDGWVINNLYAKIGASMNIHKGQKTRMSYNEAGKMTREEVLPEGTEEEDLWVGSIYPTLALVDVAMASRGEEPNMVLTGGKMVQCIAVDNNNKTSSSKDNGQEGSTAEPAKGGKEDDGAEKQGKPAPKVVIRAGEKILRAPKREPWAHNFDEDASSGRSSRTTQIIVTPATPPDVEMTDADEGSTATDEMNGLGITKVDMELPE